MKNLFCITMLFIALLLPGCLSWTSTVSLDELMTTYCADTDEGSVILKIFGDPKNESLILQAANGVMVANDYYTVEQAEKVLDECEKYLQMDNIVISGSDVFAFATQKIKWLKEKVGDDKALLSLSVLAPSLDIPDVLTPCDKQLLLIHIQQQRDVLVLYK